MNHKGRSTIFQLTKYLQLSATYRYTSYQLPIDILAISYLKIYSNSYIRISSYQQPKDMLAISYLKISYLSAKKDMLAISYLKIYQLYQLPKDMLATTYQLPKYLLSIGFNTTYQLPKWICKWQFYLQHLMSVQIQCKSYLNKILINIF